MKKFILILFAFIIHYSLFIPHCSSQWLYQPIGASGTPRDMKFFDANTGVIS